MWWWCVVVVFIFSSFVADVRIMTPSSIQGHLLAGPLFMTSQKAAQSRRMWSSLGAQGESAHQSTSLNVLWRRIASVRYYTIVPCWYCPVLVLRSASSRSEHEPLLASHGDTRCIDDVMTLKQMGPRPFATKGGMLDRTYYQCVVPATQQDAQPHCASCLSRRGQRRSKIPLSNQESARGH